MLFSAAALVKESAAQTVYKLRHKEAKIVSSSMANGTKLQKEIAGTNEFIEMGATIQFSDVNIPIGEKNNAISYSVDEVRLLKSNDTTIVQCFEIKSMNKPTIPSWYLHSSIIQASLYAALVDESTYLKTAAFMQLPESLKKKISLYSSIVEKTVDVEYDVVIPDDLFSNETFSMVRPSFSKEIVLERIGKLPVMFILKFVEIMDPTRSYSILVKASKVVLEHYKLKAKVISSLSYKEAKNFDEQYKRKEWELLSPFIEWEVMTALPTIDDTMRNTSDAIQID